jgi:putative FmdB family regulatory protein
LGGIVPTYQYVCTECGGQLEAVQRFTDDPLTVHDDCGGQLRKVFSPVGIVFKGSGFYKTDSRSGGSSGKSSTSSSSDSDSAASSSTSSDSAAKSEKSEKPEKSAKPEKSDSPANSSSGEKVA